MIFREKMIDVLYQLSKSFWIHKYFAGRYSSNNNKCLGTHCNSRSNVSVATFGAPAVAAYGIGAKVESLVLIAPSALSSGLSPFVDKIRVLTLRNGLQKDFV